MGLYVNPTNGQTKEEFLAERGKLVSKDECASFVHNGKTFPVVLVNNGPFTAAGVGFDPIECDQFLLEDGRPKAYFLVNASDLIGDGGVVGLERYIV